MQQPQQEGCRNVEEGVDGAGVGNGQIRLELRGRKIPQELEKCLTR